MTLLELVVGMALMSVFGAMFVQAVVQVYRVTNTTDAAATAQSQVALAFLRLDSQIRYASGISTPSGVGTDEYVEYLTANTGMETCGEARLRRSASQLQWREWTRGTTPGGWAVLASNVSSSTPFTLTTPTAGTAYQTLTLVLTATVNNQTTDLRTTFAAMNTSPTVDTSAYCVEGRSVP